MRRRRHLEPIGGRRVFTCQEPFGEVDLVRRADDDGTMPRVAPAKTLADQVSEIEKLILDAQQTLSQASYALETLQDRIARAAEALPEDTPPTK